MQFRQLLLASGDSPRKKNQFFFFSSYYFLYARGKKWEQAFRGDVVLPHHCVFVQHQFSFSLSLFSLMFLTCGRTDTAMEKAVPFFFSQIHFIVHIALFTTLLWLWCRLLLVFVSLRWASHFFVNLCSVSGKECSAIWDFFFFTRCSLEGTPSIYQFKQS